MARYPKMTAKAHIKIDGEDVLWYDIDIDGNVNWYLPQEKEKAVKEAKKKMLINMGNHMSRYLKSHPESFLLN